MGRLNMQNTINYQTYLLKVTFSLTDYVFCSLTTKHSTVSGRHIEDKINFLHEGGTATSLGENYLT